MLGNLTSQLTTWLLEAIKTHGLLAVVLGVVIETIIVPIPSPVIVMAAGYILIPQGTIITIILNALWISVVAGTAQTIGSFMLYLPGYYIGKPFIEKYEKYHGVSWKDVQQFQKKFSKGRRQDFTLFLLRALPIMPLSVVSGLAGVMKINPKKYTIATWIGTIPRDFILAILGFSLGEFYSALAGKIDNAETIMTVVLILMAVAYIVGQKTGFIAKVRKELLK
jgi:membrane protein DedA with SNARE-associated domain